MARFQWDSRLKNSWSCKNEGSEGGGGTLLDPFLPCCKNGEWRIYIDEGNNYVNYCTVLFLDWTLH